VGTNISLISGSIRANTSKISRLNEIVSEASDARDLNHRIRSSGIVFSNTDISVAHAALGALDSGSTVKISAITSLLSRSQKSLYNTPASVEGDIGALDTLSMDEGALRGFLEEIGASDGIVLGTPVYFGDRSSVANKLLQQTNIRRLLKDKIFGVVSVGAKRNGGQETAAIYSLYEALMQGAIVVGSGPPICQYGGTVWAGDKGSALEDGLGLSTCYATGRQVSYFSGILDEGAKSPDEGGKPRISVIVTMNTRDNYVGKYLEDYFGPYMDKADLDFINLIDYEIFRCVGCSRCPCRIVKDDPVSSGMCVLKDGADHMRQLHARIKGSDCIIIVGANNTKDDLVYRYQVFMERTRYIRRNNFELSNTPVIGMLLNEPEGINNPMHNIKVLTSYIRHNTMMLKPINIILIKGKVVYSDRFDDHLALLGIIKKGRSSSGAVSISYEAEGYSDKTYDNMRSERS